MKRYWEYEYPIGKIGIAETDGAVTGVFFADLDKYSLQGFEQYESGFIQKAANQLDEYFAKKRKEFDLPLYFEGTAFQKRVWAALLTIPYGETRSYGEIAIQIGNPKAPRAVGMANNRNPIAIVCPCHRVIGSDGSLVGYAAGLNNKEFLLNLESGCV
jgi:methylated-DNA-[protein]-cysteine S-methyltransferase